MSSSYASMSTVNLTYLTQQLLPDHVSTELSVIQIRYFLLVLLTVLFFFSSRRRHTRLDRDWSSDVCSSDLVCRLLLEIGKGHDCTPVTDRYPMSSSA